MESTSVQIYQVFINRFAVRVSKSIKVLPSRDSLGFEGWGFWTTCSMKWRGGRSTCSWGGRELAVVTGSFPGWVKGGFALSLNRSFKPRPERTAPTC